MCILNRKTTLLFFLFHFSLLIRIAAQNNQQLYAEIDSLNELFSKSIDQTANYASLVNYAEEALKRSRNVSYAKGEAVSLTQIGITLLYRGHYNEALKQYFSALQLYDRHQLHQNKKEYARLLINISIAFLFTEDYDRGLEYGQKAATVAKQSGDKDILGRSYHCIGNMYLGKALFDKSSYFHNKALELFTQTNNLRLLAALYIDMGISNAETGNLKHSIAYTLKAHELHKQLGFKERFAITFLNVAEDSYSLKLYSKACAYLDSAQNYAQKFDRAGDLKLIYPLKAKLYVSLGNVDSSAHYYEKTLQLKDSLYNETYKKELAALQMQSDIYKKDTENKLLSKDNRIAELLRNLAIAGIIALIILLGFILLNQRLRIQRRVKDKLEEEVANRTKEISLQKETIFQTNLQLKLALNSAKFDSHFTFNVLNAIQHVVLQKKPLEAQDHLAKLSRLMRYVLEKSPLDHVFLSDELQMLERYIQLEQLRLDYHFTYTIDVQADEQTTIPALLLQPYIENAILHGLAPATGENLHLQIELKDENDLLIIFIKDNGVGRKKANKSSHQSLGSKIGQERLDILTHLTQKNHIVVIEDLAMDSDNNKGTKVKIQIPKESRQIAKEPVTAHVINSSLC